VRNGARWHLIGHLQTNKAGAAAALFDFVPLSRQQARSPMPCQRTAGGA